MAEHLLYPDLFEEIPIVGGRIATALEECSENLAATSAEDQDISVVIRAMNEQESLSNLLDSVARQKFAAEVEVIVVDIESSDNTEELPKILVRQ